MAGTMTLIAGRSSKQGTSLNVGKLKEEYIEVTSTVEMMPCTRRTSPRSNREEERGIVSFVSRRKAIERVGLPEVRQYRLARCAAEENEWRT